jgi:hypothetical protein
VNQGRHSSASLPLSRSAPNCARNSETWRSTGQEGGEGADDEKEGARLALKGCQETVAGQAYMYPNWMLIVIFTYVNLRIHEHMYAMLSRTFRHTLELLTLLRH